MNITDTDPDTSTEFTPSEVSTAARRVHSDSYLQVGVCRPGLTSRFRQMPCTGVSMTPVITTIWSNPGGGGRRAWGV
jgi:hypothetical protein